MSKRHQRKGLQLKKIVMMMRVLYMVQTVMVVAVVVGNGIRYLINGEIPTTQSIFMLLLVLALMVAFNGYFIFRDTNVFKRLNTQIEIKDEAYKNIEALNLELRAQRHDFLNHIQILYSLMELGEYDETTNYLNRLYGDVGKLSANIKTSSIAVNALLQAKANEAAERDIHYETVINTRLEQMNMPDWTLCRVLGNLIDNSFEASEQQVSNAGVSIDIRENITDYLIEIQNTSPLMTEGIISKMFNPGFTTKKDGMNHGMGLYISKEIMDKYNNEIGVNYTDGKMIIRVLIHKALAFDSSSDS